MVRKVCMTEVGDEEKRRKKEHLESITNINDQISDRKNVKLNRHDLFLKRERNTDGIQQ
jgi:hypothetical protein